MTEPSSLTMIRRRASGRTADRRPEYRTSQRATMRRIEHRGYARARTLAQGWETCLEMAAHDREYLLPEGVGVPEAQAVLAAHLELDGGSARSVERTYFDTFDGRLHAAGLRLVHERGRLLLRDAAGSERAALDHPKRPRRLTVDDLPAGRLREQLAPVVEVRALTPVARTRSRMLDLRVLDDQAKTVVRLEVEAASARANGRPVPLPPRLRVTGVRGYDKALARVQRTLAGDAALGAAPEPLSDAAIRAAG